MTRKFAFGLLLLLLLTLFLFSSFFLNSKNNLTSFLNNFSGSISEPSNERKIAELEKENQSLKFQLLGQKVRKANTVKVYSAYPFNNRGEVTIAAGATSGLKIGSAITYGDNVLVGKITKIFDSTSVVTTIFDPSWKSAVRIGEKEIDALLQGGNEITVTLIPADADIHEGELVVTASDDLPYGLGVGVIKNIRTAPGGAFKEGVLEPSFQFKQLKDVNIYN